MNIDELHKRKDRLQEDMLALIRSFEKDTDLWVSSVYYETGCVVEEGRRIEISKNIAVEVKLL